MGDMPRCRVNGSSQAVAVTGNFLVCHKTGFPCHFAFASVHGRIKQVKSKSHNGNALWLSVMRQGWKLRSWIRTCRQICPEADRA